MGRATNKDDLIISASEKFSKLTNLIESMNEKELSKEFNFSNDEKKKEAHWGRDKDLRDIYIHLYEWHKLLLNWVNSNLNGDSKPFIPEPYNWRTYGDMNLEFWKNHQTTSLERSKELFIQSHNDVMNLATKFTNDELFKKAEFDWVGGSTLGSYFVSATASHYDWAIKKINAHIKNCKELQ